jgi:prepilin-type processing-associated H-X9-DG protein
VGATPEEGRSPASFGRIEDPASTVLMCDSAYWNPAGDWDSYEGIAQNNYLRAPSDLYYTGTAYWGGIGPNVHFRHNGVVNVAYCDGHVEAVATMYNQSADNDELGDLSADDSAYDLE